MNRWLQIYRLLTGIGILVNLTFAFSAFFYHPLLIHQVGSGHAELFDDIWLGNTGMFIFLMAWFYLPTVIDPRRDTLYSWISAWSRVFSAFYWVLFLTLRLPDLPRSFWTIPVSDATIGVITALALYLGLPRRGTAG